MSTEWSVQLIILAKIVTLCVVLETINLDITFVTIMATKFALMVGRKTLITKKEITVPKLYVLLDAITNTVIVTNPANANAEMAGLDKTVMNVLGTLDVCMEPVMNPGPAIVKKAGVAFFATRI